ncbi:hypothetical protein [Caudoviricetes sp.]|nr:hypothetical protein [Caudoviricetes sp.]
MTPAHTSSAGPKRSSAAASAQTQAVRPATPPTRSKKE